MNKVKRYIEVCHIYLKTKPKYKKNKPVYGRIPVDYAPIQDLSIDIKNDAPSIWRLSFAISNNLQPNQLHYSSTSSDRQTQTVAKALIHREIYPFGLPRQIVCDEATEFTSTIVQAILMMLNCRLKVISPYNHDSSKCE